MLGKPADSQEKERLAYAMARLHHSPDWRLVQSWLEQERTRLTDQVIDSGSDEARGAVQTLRYLLTSIEEAQDEANHAAAWREKTGPTVRPA